MKRYAWWVVGVVILAFLIQDPGSAAHVTHELGTIFGHVLAETSKFLSHL